MLEIVLIFVFLQLIISLMVFKNDIFSPAVGFDIAFFVAILDLILMKEYWAVDIGKETVNVLVMGIGIYNLVCIFLKDSIPRTVGFGKKIYNSDILLLPEKVMTVLIGIYGIVIILVIFCVNKSNGLGLSISNYISVISNNRELSLPAIVSIIYTICNMAGYIWCYLFAKYFSYRKKINIKLMLLIIETIVLSLAIGKRGTLVGIVICCIVFMMNELKINFSKKLSKKIYGITFLLLVCVAFSFQSIATAMCRDSYLFNPFEYFSIYLGAPILNLDTSIKNKYYHHPVFLSETLHSLYTSIGENFNIPELIYDTDRAFLSSPNGKRVGNVDTVFYDFYHDGGMMGVLILTAIMAVIAQRLYNKVKYNKTVNLMFSTMLYAYIYWLTIRSFFANSLYEWVTLSTLETLAIWWFGSYVIQKYVKNKNSYNRSKRSNCDE